MNFSRSAASLQLWTLEFILVYLECYCCLITQKSLFFFILVRFNQVLIIKLEIIFGCLCFSIIARYFQFSDISPIDCFNVDRLKTHFQRRSLLVPNPPKWKKTKDVRYEGLDCTALTISKVIIFRRWKQRR